MKCKESLTAGHGGNHSDSCYSIKAMVTVVQNNKNHLCSGKMRSVLRGNGICSHDNRKKSATAFSKSVQQKGLL